MGIRRYTTRTLHDAAMLSPSQPRHKCTVNGDRPLSFYLLTHIDHLAVCGGDAEVGDERTWLELGLGLGLGLGPDGWSWGWT